MRISDWSSDVCSSDLRLIDRPIRKVNRRLWGKASRRADSARKKPPPGGGGLVIRRPQGRSEARFDLLEFGDHLLAQRRWNRCLPQGVFTERLDVVVAHAGEEDRKGTRLNSSH